MKPSICLQLFKRWPLLLAALALGGVIRHANAQAYPDRPITLVIPFAAGGPTDVVARMIAIPMGKSLGQPVIVENTLGAGGTIATNRVAKAPANGYTVLLHHMGMSTAPALYRKLPFDPLTDFEYVGQVLDVPMTLLARKASVSLSSTGLGVPLGAYMPCQTLTSKPFMPCSSSVGMLGRAERRCNVVTPNTLTRPSLMMGTVCVVWSHSKSTWPPMRSFIAGPVPL